MPTNIALAHTLGKYSSWPRLRSQVLRVQSSGLRISVTFPPLTDVRFDMMNCDVPTSAFLDYRYRVVVVSTKSRLDQF